MIQIVYWGLERYSGAEAKGAAAGLVAQSKALLLKVSTRILGRRTAPFQLFLIPYRAPHGFTPRS